jgi:hypothetical protein
MLRLLVKKGIYSMVTVNMAQFPTVARSLSTKVPVTPPSSKNNLPSKAAAPDDNVDEDELEHMFVQGPKGIEWGGPTRGGKYPEPTRYGDWERKGRVTDF